jgi:stage II sporulation protein D
LTHPNSDGKHGNADICSDPAHCQAWQSFDTLKAAKGGAYDAVLAAIGGAVDSTAGLCVTYEGEPILAVFHAASGGYTEDSVNVWRESLPYLTSVQSPESSTSVPDFVTSETFTAKQFRKTALAAYPTMNLDGAPASWFTSAERSPTGRLISVNLGGVKLSGNQLRQLFGLRSANIEWAIGASDNGGASTITFTVTGYGHGVGLSQYGANEFARLGASFEDILAYYYVGTEVAAISE